jgi:hypothetical protein
MATHRNSNVERIQETWIKPRANFMKCNVDASFSINHDLVGIGIIIRDHRGHFFMAKSIQFSPLLPVLEGKAKSLLHAINWVIELGLLNVVFELDTKIVVDAVNNSKVDMTDFGSIIDQCRNLVQSLSNSSVVFIGKKANKAASVLASVALDMTCPEVYHHVPLCISSIVFNEMI